MADGELQHQGVRPGQHDLWSQLSQSQTAHQQQPHSPQQTHAANAFLAMRLPHGLFPYSGGMAGHPAAYATHPAALAAHHAAAAAAWNNLKQSPVAAAAAAAAAAAGFQPLPRYWLHPHWPAHAAVFDANGMTTHPEAGSSPPQHADFTPFMMQHHQSLQSHHALHQTTDSRSPVSSPASSIMAGDSPTPEPVEIKVPNVDKAILDLRVKIAGTDDAPLMTAVKQTK